MPAVLLHHPGLKPLFSWQATFTGFHVDRYYVPAWSLVIARVPPMHGDGQTATKPREADGDLPNRLIRKQIQ